EVDDDAGRPVLIARGKCVCDSIRPDLARIVVPNGDPGLDARTGDEDRGAHPPRGEVLVGANERRHGGGQADAVDDVEIEESREQDSELVAGAVRLRRGAARLAELCVIEQPEDGLRIPYVDREKEEGLAGR